MPGSGKTTILRVLEKLCRHSIAVTDVSSAAFYRAYEETVPTLLIDETSTVADPKKVLHLLRSGSTPGFAALRKDSFYKCYGPKVFAFLAMAPEGDMSGKTYAVGYRKPSKRLIQKGPIRQSKGKTSRNPQFRNGARTGAARKSRYQGKRCPQGVSKLEARFTDTGRWPASFDRFWEALKQRRGKQAGTRAMIDVLLPSRQYGYPRLKEAVEKRLDLSCFDGGATGQWPH